MHQESGNAQRFPGSAVASAKQDLSTPPRVENTLLTSGNLEPDLGQVYPEVLEQALGVVQAPGRREFNLEVKVLSEVVGFSWMLLFGIAGRCPDQGSPAVGSSDWAGTGSKQGLEHEVFGGEDEEVLPVSDRLDGTVGQLDVAGTGLSQLKVLDVGPARTGRVKLALVIVGWQVLPVQSGDEEGMCGQQGLGNNEEFGGGALSRSGGKVGLNER